MTRPLLWRVPAAVLALLPALLLSGATATPQPLTRAPVLVNFEQLAWVDARTSLPRLEGGRILAPPAESCDLLGLSCQQEGDTLRIGTETLALTVVQGVPLVPLSRLVTLAGQRIGWNSAARRATVYGGTGQEGWRSALAEITARTPPALNVYPGPITVSTGPRQAGVPTVALTLTTALPLRELTLLSRTDNGLTLTGSLVPRSADVSTAFQGCPPGQSCTLPAPRDALWTLAYATGR